MHVNPEQRCEYAKIVASIVLRLPRDYGEVYLARLCGDDDALRGQVERLLFAEQQAVLQPSQDDDGRVTGSV